MTVQQLLVATIASFVVTVIIGYFLIPVLRRLKFGQTIREEGPESHQQKAGTPTMGGLIFFASIIVTTIVLAFVFDVWATEIGVLLVVFFGYGVIGFLDDIIIVVKKQNEGLTSLQKLIGQIVVAIVAYFLLQNVASFDTTLALPFIEQPIDLGIFYILFLVFWLVGFSNAINLTDGLDGLVGGTGTFAFGAFTIIAASTGYDSVALVTTIVTGAMLGFLVYNKNPAKVFMGDTGSLALGGLIAAVSIVLKVELLLLVIGIVYVVETLSVIIQVTSFKLTGKRVFKMSPIHHHFEESGWTERKVVTTFWAVGLLAAIVATMWEVM